MKRCLGGIVCLALLMLASCGSNEVGSSRDVNPETVYFDYKVWGEEGKDDMVVLAQYRYGGVNGTTLVLEEPSKVELDGEVIPPDSSRMTGAFYEMMKPAATFSGTHSIEFTDINKKKYKESFTFQPLSLRTNLPPVIQRSDLVFELDGLEPVDYVRVLLTDTSFRSEGINRIDTVRNGRILVKKADLVNLVNGPIHLELIKENERPVKEGTVEGGVFSIAYGIKREFNLED